MSILRAARAPRRARAASDVLDLVEGVLNVRLEGVPREDVGSLVDVQAGVESDDGLRLEVLGPIQELEQAKAVRGAIPPWAEVPKQWIRRSFRSMP